jgi:N-acetylglucosaminyl-diphospho-decaprenol L-rhamnosyltransferase
MRTSPRVTVVVIHRDRVDVIGKTVTRFREQSVPTEVIVVDNGSTPETQSRLADEIGDAWLIRTGANLGFGPGGNVGLRRWLHHHQTEWVAVAPHDAVPQPDTLERMLDALDDRLTVGLASADVGDGMVPVIHPYLGTIEALPTVEEGFELSGYPHGTLMLARRACLEEVGLFDERYFAYCEEAELALRAANAGWQCGLIRGAMVNNPGMSASIERVAYLQLRNTLLMIREHFGRRQVAFRILVALLQVPIGLVRPAARGLHWSPRGRLLGVRDYLRGRFGPPAADVRI